MISINKKEECCGCLACVQKCPKQCIVMKTDCEGFFYPKIYETACIDCGLCEKVCPVIQSSQANYPFISYAAINREKSVRLENSSGGIFTLLAEKH